MGRLFFLVYFGCCLFSSYPLATAGTWVIAKQTKQEKKYNRSYLIKMAVELNRKSNAGHNEELVRKKTGILYDVWWKHRNTRYQRIKDPKIAIALALTENWMMTKRSNKGCLGEMQLSLKTAHWIVTMYKIPHHDSMLAMDLETLPEFNFAVGLATLDQELRAWKGNVDLAILSYKFGRGKLYRTLKARRMTRKMANYYAKVYRYGKFIDGAEGFRNPNKYHRPTDYPGYNQQEVRHLYNQRSAPRTKNYWRS